VTAFPTFSNFSCFHILSRSQSLPTALTNVEIKIEITFDNYPEDTSWDLYNTCNGDNEKIGHGGDYTFSEAAGKTVPVYDKTIHDGTFKFMIFDEYGDGLCCTQGKGGYTIFYGLDNFPGTLLNPKKNDYYMFGFANKCAPVSPTNIPTYQPTSLPTVSSTNVQIKIVILFDQYPADISWILYDNCVGGKMIISSGNDYDVNFALQPDEVYDNSIHDGSFVFIIFDAYGDGLCCTHGDGSYTIFYGDKKIFSDFKSPNFYEAKLFGEAIKCAVSQTNKALYDSSLGVPKCVAVDKTCTTVGTGPTGELKGELLIGKDIWGEANGSNTLDTCTDGNSGEYGVAESVEAISVRAVEGEVLKSLGKVRVIARIFAYAGEVDRVDFFYSSTPGPNPNWTLISTETPAEGGIANLVSGEYHLPDAELQAVRVSIRYVNETPDSTSCPTSAGAGAGTFSDVDDLVFLVDTTSSGETSAFALSQPGPVVLPELSEELQMNCAEVLESDRCKAAIDCEWRSDSIIGDFMILGKSSCHPAQ